MSDQKRDMWLACYNMNYALEQIEQYRKIVAEKECELAKAINHTVDLLNVAEPQIGYEAKELRHKDRAYKIVRGEFDEVINLEPIKTGIQIDSSDVKIPSEPEPAEVNGETAAVTP